MSQDKSLRQALEDAIDEGGLTTEDVSDAAVVLTAMQAIIQHCTPMDCALPPYQMGMKIQGTPEDFCSFYLPIKAQKDLSTFENREVKTAEGVFARAGAMFVDYGLSYEEHHDGILLVVRRHQQALVKQLAEDIETAIAKNGVPELDITYQPR